MSVLKSPIIRGTLTASQIWGGGSVAGSLGDVTSIRNLCLAILLLASLAAPAQLRSGRPAGSPAADFEQAKEYLAHGAVDEALSNTKRGLEESPNSVEGLNLLAVIYQQQGKHEDAVGVLQQVLKTHPNSTDTLNNLATIYAAQNQTDLAEQAFRKVLRFQPSNPTAAYNLGLILLAHNQPKEAAAYLATVPSSDTATRLTLVRAYLDAGMTVQALRTATSLSRERAKDTKVHFSLGILLGARRQYQPAIHEFELANALEPGNFDILHDLGQAYVLGGPNEKAQQTLNEALRLQPDSTDTLYLLAQADSNLQKDVDALELLVRARKLAPKNTDVLFLMARLSMKQSFFDDAIELLNEGVKLDPRRPDFHAALGESYFTVGKIDMATEEFKTLIELDPSPRSYALMGLCYRHLGKYDEAKSYLSESLSADPNNPLALFNLGFIARKQGDNDQAEQYLRHALGIDPSYPDALFELGSLKMDLRKYDEAIPILRHCAEISSRPAEAYYKLAMAERGLHQLPAAQRDMNIFQTLAKNPQPGPYPLQHFYDYLERRSALTAAQQSEADLRELQAEVHQHPDRPRSLYLLAEALFKLGRMDEAMQTIKRLEDVSGGDFRTQVNIGVLLARCHLYPAAIQYLQAALKINPHADDANYNLAETYFESGDYEKSLQSLLQASPEGQKDPAYLALTGDDEAHLGRNAEAVKAFEQALAGSPDNDHYYVSLALAQLQSGDLENAERTLHNGLARIPDSGALYWASGVAAGLSGRTREAEYDLKKAAELMPSRETVLASLGIFYYEGGRIAEARQVLQRCMEMFPNGAIDLAKVSAVLDAASESGKSGQRAGLSPEARHEFYQLALAMADQDR
jgi:tetratricopeptide (TPR) repeat protein